MGILYDTIRKPNLHRYKREMNENGSEKHITCNGARFHVRSWALRRNLANGKEWVQERCSESNCEINHLPSNRDDYQGDD